ncbi:Secretory laccase, putative isoform 1 [Hibiscus syriacus]|uniref:Secretory laccase, putative isoform 1 n=1 Tax=Hibiscus syriacus TaxID=106335 RepID=A0A6A3B3I1_HIBSY|nr:laccase-12-like [Hibiscus syriacus]KAE8709842.1 Secretory laccase, putative isoform 1 [Hibiscus syriacus]
MGSQKQAFILLSVLSFFNFLLLSGADDVYYEFILQETEFTKLCSTKTVLTVNGSFPGPEIRARRDDTVYVNVHNQGRFAVSIVWEGIRDSINGVNELIQPGRNFTYEIELDDEIGTLWWHARSAWAKATVYGAFVILPAAGEEYPFPAPTSDHAIILGEWFRQELTESVVPGQPDAYAINGHLGESYGCNDTSYQLQVDYQGLYLLRLINAVANETMVFAIAQHSLTIVGQNASYAQRSFSNSLTLAPGQTVDVLLSASQNVGQYYITARSSSSGRLNTTGILYYTTSTGF